MLETQNVGRAMGNTHVTEQYAPLEETLVVKDEETPDAEESEVRAGPDRAPVTDQSNEHAEQLAVAGRVRVGHALLFGI